MYATFGSIRALSEALKACGAEIDPSLGHQRTDRPKPETVELTESKMLMLKLIELETLPCSRKLARKTKTLPEVYG